MAVKKIFYVVNGRFPTKKAYGIQLAKMCEALIHLGLLVVLVVPDTHAARTHRSVQEFYNLSVDIPIVRIPSLDGYGKGWFWFVLSTLLFTINSFIYLLWQRIRGTLKGIYTVDMDTFSFSVLPIIGPVVAEMHDTKPMNVFTQFFFSKVSVVAVNSVLAEELRKKFSISSNRIIAEQNGIDEQWFSHKITKEVARKSLSLTFTKPIVMYVGRFYDWKGIDVLASACALTPDIDCVVVGGTLEEFQNASARKDIPDNMYFMGEAAPHDIPTWLAAADILVLLGTKRDASTYLYRSPMKTYEYMAMHRPVVASSAPAVTAIVSQDEAVFYQPDNASDMARAIQEVFSMSPDALNQLMQHAARRVEKHTWTARAQRISRLMELTYLR